MTASIPVVTAPLAAPKIRVPFWDNARFACVALVVIGHGIQRLTANSDNALTVYLLIYAFHMPAFAIISGYFSKSGSPTVRQMRKVITDILLPYFIMETIWTIVQWLVEGKVAFNPTTPSWTLWFLLALGIFRLLLPYLALVKWPLFWAVFFSVGVGYLNNVDSTFSLSRAIGILPFFVLGWKLKQWGLVEKWRLVEKPTWFIRAGAIAVFGVWLWVIVANIKFFRAVDLRFWFFYDDSYRGLGEGEWWAGAVRLGLIALAVLLSAAFFVLIPRSETWITDMGQSTMYVYLLHSFILYPLRETTVLKGDEHAHAVYLLGMILACIAIAVALTAPAIKKVFRPIIEPRANWLFSERASDKPSKKDPTGARRS
jgi:fucose 4-O-acetylase-like acetyltransferase